MNDMTINYLESDLQATIHKSAILFYAMDTRHFLKLRRFIALLLPILLTLSACDLFQGDVVAVMTPTAAVTVAPTVAVPQITVESPGVSEPSEQITTLRVWLPPEIGARSESGSQELASQIRAFETGYSNLDVVIEQKPVDGAGGIINYLQSGRKVAPDIMPDLVAVPSSLLSDTKASGLFYPLSSINNERMIQQTYPASAAQVTMSDQPSGYPFAILGLTHLIFNPEVITQTVPIQWTQFISDTNHTLVLPADSREGALLGLQFYIAEGGTLVDSTGRTTLESEPLARALATIGVRKENLLQSHQLKTLDEAWQYHQLGLSDFMWMRSDFLLGRQAIDPSLLASQSYMAVPGLNGHLLPLVTSWSWAMTTDDPARQKLAEELISFLILPENLANWSQRSQVLPAQRAAMEVMSDQNPYLQFASGQLELAKAMPVSETSRLMDVLGDAVFQLLTTDTPPEIIAEQAVTALRQ